MLHDYQKYAVDQIIKKPYIGLFLEMGLGKTLITLTAIEKLKNEYFDVDKILVIAPLRVATDTWPREAAKWPHLAGLRLALVVGSPQARMEALRKPADVYVINRECVAWIVSYLGKAWDFDTVILDELSSFKNWQSKRFKALKRIRPRLRRVIGLTGTPAPNGLIDLWAQMYLLDEGASLGKSIGGYRARYFTPGRRNGNIIYSWDARDEAETNIYKAISGAVVSMRGRDHLTLPELTEVIQPVSIGERGWRMIVQLEQDLLLPYEDGDVTGQTAAVLSGKLLQMASGAVYDEYHNIHLIHDDKIDALRDAIEGANGRPVVVFYNFQHSLIRLQEAFPGARVLRKGAAGTADIDAWNNNQIPILLIHPKSAGHGLNLQESDCRHLIWFDQVWGLEDNQQAVARVYRQGQRNNIIVIRLVAEGTIDEDVCKAITRKATGQAALMEAVRARIDKIKGGGAGGA